jgi:hypothetical protein
MNRNMILYGLYCLGVLFFATIAIRDGYSPFATAGARPPMLLGSPTGLGGGYGGYGPTHK